MKIQIPCTKCIFSGSPNLNPPATVAVRDDGCYEVTCENGHREVVLLQQDKSEILFEIGAHAILDGYYREAVASFASALERFYEFSIRLLITKDGKRPDEFEACWKEVSNSSERQLGAFLFVWNQYFEKKPVLLHQKMVKYRNSVIHKGKIPTYDEAVKFGDSVFQVIGACLSQMHGANLTSEIIRMVTETVDRKDSVGEVQVGSMSIRTLISLADANLDRFSNSIGELLDEVKLVRVAMNSGPVELLGRTIDPSSQAEEEGSTNS